ncbi:MAG: hypothetical protein MHPSP_002490, partial [Paramarteilia canceri]
MLKNPFMIESIALCHLIVNDYIACYPHQTHKLSSMIDESPKFCFGLALIGPYAIIKEIDKFPASGFVSLIDMVCKWVSDYHTEMTASFTYWESKNIYSSAVCFELILSTMLNILLKSEEIDQKVIDSFAKYTHYILSFLMIIPSLSRNPYAVSQNMKKIFRQTLDGIKNIYQEYNTDLKLKFRCIFEIYFQIAYLVGERKLLPTFVVILHELKPYLPP